MLKCQEKAFTLLELVVVVIIVGLLATLTIPQFTRIRERTLDQEAKSSLRLLQQAEKIYRLERGTYYPTAGTQTNITRINNNLRLSLDENIWDYRVSSAGTSTALRSGRTWTLTIANVNATCTGSCF